MSAQVVDLASWDRAARVAADILPPPPPLPDMGFAFGPHVELRDLFAAFALSGIFANSNPGAHEHFNEPSDIAQACYLIADAMLVERNNNRIKPTVH